MAIPFPDASRRRRIQAHALAGQATVSGRVFKPNSQFQYEKRLIGLKELASSSSFGKAERAIRKMPVGRWIDIRTLAKEAGLGVHAMSRFLIRAKKAGQVDYKRVNYHSAKLSLWKRLT